MTRVSKLSALAALIVLTLPACSSSKSATAPGSPSPSSTSTSSSAPTTSTTSPSPSGTASTSPSGAATPTAPAISGTQITISKFLYVPENLLVKPGAKVTVINQDPVAHTVTGNAGGGAGIPFDTGNIDGNAAGTFTAPTTPGTYSYGCIYHPQMHGTLTVKA